uniref:Uncharacterized protein n=1 Tax=Anguilla anguilla TaxID=7936 RepID=A0A0E9SAD4_ANGAN
MKLYRTKPTSPSSRSSVSVYDSGPHLHFLILFVFIPFN